MSGRLNGLDAYESPPSTTFASLPRDTIRPRWGSNIADLIEFATATGLAAVMALAGSAKILDPGGAIAFLKHGLGLSAVVSIPIVYSLSALELLLAAVIILGIGRWKWPITATLALIGCFFGLLFEVRLLHPNVGMTCGCFGRLQSPLGGESLSSHIKFNIGLTAACILNLAAIYTRQRLTRRPESAEHA